MERKNKDITEVILHHTVSPKDTTVSQIRQWHEERGLGTGIQYHFVIPGSGDVIQTRSPKKVGHHCKGHNEESIGIALCGNFELEAPTEFQIEALQGLLLKLCRKYELHAWNIYKHKDRVTPGYTLCPGKYFDLSPILAYLASYIGSKDKEDEPKENVPITVETIEKEPNLLERIGLWLKHTYQRLSKFITNGS